MDEPKHKSRFRFSLRALIALFVISSLCIALVTAKRQIAELEAKLRILAASPIDLFLVAAFIEQNGSIGSTRFLPTHVKYEDDSNYFVVDCRMYVEGRFIYNRHLVFRYKRGEYVADLPEQQVKSLHPGRGFRVISTGRSKKLILPFALPKTPKLVSGWEKKEVSISRAGRLPHQLPKPAVGKADPSP